jgi:hypothetical protein
LLVGDADRGVRLELDTVLGEVRLTASRNAGDVVKTRMTPNQARYLAVLLGRMAGEADEYAESAIEDEAVSTVMAKD